MLIPVQKGRIRDAKGKIVAMKDDNHQTRTSIRLLKPVVTDRLIFDGFVIHGR
jgi:hypothetical protein